MKTRENNVANGMHSNSLFSHNFKMQNVSTQEPFCLDEKKGIENRKDFHNQIPFNRQEEKESIYDINKLSEIANAIGYKLVKKHKGYINCQKTVKAAEKNKLSICDYVESIWDTKGATKGVINAMQNAGCFKRLNRVCEIGPGTGIYLEHIKNRGSIDDYVIYETASDWADWLEDTYHVTKREADGKTLKYESDNSCDLVHAHGVFVYLKVLHCFKYFKEMFRICKPKGYITFDFFPDDLFDVTTVNNWISADADYPVILPNQTVKDFFKKLGAEFITEFQNKCGYGYSLYHVYQISDKRIEIGEKLSNKLTTEPEGSIHKEHYGSCQDNLSSEDLHSDSKVAGPLMMEVDYGEMPEHELKILCQIVNKIQPGTIFEFGTFLGQTTLQLAANSKAQIYTLDLPPKGHHDYSVPVVDDPELDVYPKQPGVKFQNTPYATRIKQLYGDSQKFDFSPFYDKVDCVFVDANHHYKNVLRDSMNAFKMIKANGVIIWHDYASYAPGVIRALEVISKKFLLNHIKGTSLAIYFGKRNNGNIDNYPDLNSEGKFFFRRIKKIIHRKGDVESNKLLNVLPKNLSRDAKLIIPEADRLIKAGNMQQAKKILLDLIANAPDDVDALTQLALVECKEENYPSAIEFIKGALIVDPLNDNAKLVLQTIQEIMASP